MTIIVSVSIGVITAVAVSVPVSVSSCWALFACLDCVARSGGCWSVSGLFWLSCSSAMTIGSAAVSPLSWFWPVLW